MTAQASTRQSVTRTVPVAADRLFGVLVDPPRHAEIAASGTIRRAVTTDHIRKVGDVFTMDMNEAPFGDYRIDNHVVEFQQDRRIAWAPAGVGRRPHGHVWAWELTPDGGSTIVTHSYDWSDVTDEAVLARVNYPRVSIAQMVATIDNLIAAAS